MATSKELLKAQANGCEIRITIAGQPTGGRVEYSPRGKGDRHPWTYLDARHVYRYAAAECAAIYPAPVEPVTEEVPVPVAAPAVTPEMVEALAVLRDVAGVFAAIDKATPVTEPERVTEEVPVERAVPVTVTPEVVEALAVLRDVARRDMAELKVVDAIHKLDDAGVFAAIDKATDFDQGLTCTCAAAYLAHNFHTEGCPLAPVPEQVTECVCVALYSNTQNFHTGGCPATGPVAKTVQCDHCRGDYVPKADGTLRKHDCRRYDHELRTHVFGPLDRADRARRDREAQTARWQRAVGLKPDSKS